MSWETVALNASSPGSFLMLETLFENGHGAFSLLGEGGQRPEALGDRAARMMLKFLEGESAVDPFLADQLAVPLAVAGCGGRVSTSAVTRHLETVAEVLTAFGVPARTWGRLAGPGGLEVDPRLPPPTALSASKVRFSDTVPRAGPSRTASAGAIPCRWP